MKTKFTPGPWNADIAEACYVRDGADNQIAIFTHLNTRTGGRRNADIVAANARAAAAAPELIEAAEWAANYIDTIIDPAALRVLAALRGAVAKATGEQA